MSTSTVTLPTIKPSTRRATRQYTMIEYESGTVLDRLVETMVMQVQEPGESVPAYSSDITAAWLMEEKLEERGLVEHYVRQLWLEACGSRNNTHLTRSTALRYPLEWYIARTPADVRCRAALFVVTNFLGN